MPKFTPEEFMRRGGITPQPVLTPEELAKKEELGKEMFKRYQPQQPLGPQPIKKPFPQPYPVKPLPSFPPVIGLPKLTPEQQERQKKFPMGTKMGSFKMRKGGKA